MNGDLTDIPFDHYQRYAAAASIVQSLGARARTVLEVGANRQRLLGDFLSGHRLLYTDLEPQDSADDFVVADACALPFADKSYDAVVSLDVLEHIPPGSRVQAVAEMARVATRVVVIGCPLDRPWVHEAEQLAHDVWRRYFDRAYPWLEEHQEHGLVEASQVEATLRSAGLQVIRLGLGETGLWASLMGAHFIKEAVPELAGVVAAADRYYNRSLFEGDRSESAYREFFIGLCHDEDVDAMRGAAVLVGRGDAGGIALLSALGRGLIPVVDRVRHAELQWQQTAKLLGDAETRLQHEALAHHCTGLKLQQMATSASEQLRRADLADQKHSVLAAELAQARARLHASEQQAEVLSADLDRLGLQRDELSAHVDMLAAERDALSSNVDTLVAERDELSAHVGMLAAERDALSANVSTLAAERDALGAHVDTLAAERDALSAHVDRLAAERDALSALADSLAEERDALNAHVERLSLRTRGLERRQRWAIVGAVVAVLVAVVGYFAWR